ncbi:recombination protein U [Streptococcus pneumoniae]|nr:recombination protein U [Streptococcus pneumoniae]
MKNFHPHQIQHMEQVLAQQGICFVLLHFSSQQETYLLPAFDLIRFYHQDKGQKSMPLEYIREAEEFFSTTLARLLAYPRVN